MPSRSPKDCSCPCHQGAAIFCSCFVECCDAPGRDMRPPKLLSRDEFREGVFARDKHQCVICKAPAGRSPRRVQDFRKSSTHDAGVSGEQIRKGRLEGCCSPSRSDRSRLVLSVRRADSSGGFPVLRRVFGGAESALPSLVRGKVQRVPRSTELEVRPGERGQGEHAASCGSEAASRETTLAGVREVRQAVRVLRGRRRAVPHRRSCEWWRSRRGAGSGLAWTPTEARFQSEERAVSRALLRLQLRSKEL